MNNNRNYIIAIFFLIDENGKSYIKIYQKMFSIGDTDK